MPIYNYVGLNKKGEVVKGKVEAENPKAARQSVKDLGYLPTKVTTDTSSSSGGDKGGKKSAHHSLQSLTLKEKMDSHQHFKR